MMLVKGIVDEDFVNYKKPSMFISTNTCSFKCDKESGRQCCQNSNLARAESLEIDTAALVDRYLSNPITKAVVFGGLEPMDQFQDVLEFLHLLREVRGCADDVVIYTGYEKEEVSQRIWALSAFPNVVVKFGRFIPDSDYRFDAVLGVLLASKNQYAEKIS